MNVAIVGCGFIARTHAEIINKLGHKLVAVIGSNEESARVFANEYGALDYGTDFDRVLEDDIEVVHICTPPAYHYEMVCKVIDAHKHVICEKPLCVDGEQAFKLYSKSLEENVVCAVNFNVRYYDACNRIKAIISGDDFGKISMIHGRYLQEFHILPSEYSWRYDNSKAGKMRATTEIGSHWIDLARFLTGLEIEAVSAVYSTASPKRYIEDGIMHEAECDDNSISVESEDVAMVHMKMSNGSIASVVLSEISHGRINYLEIEVAGSKQSVWWNSEDPYKVGCAQKGEGVTTVTNAFTGGFPDTFEAFFKDVYEDIRNGKCSKKATYPTFHDGYINAAVCDAIYSSANADSSWIKVKI